MCMRFYRAPQGGPAMLAAGCEDGMLKLYDITARRAQRCIRVVDNEPCGSCASASGRAVHAARTDVGRAWPVLCVDVDAGASAAVAGFPGSQAAIVSLRDARRQQLVSSGGRGTNDIALRPDERLFAAADWDSGYTRALRGARAALRTVLTDAMAPSVSTYSHSITRRAGRRSYWDAFASTATACKRWRFPARSSRSRSRSRTTPTCSRPAARMSGLPCGPCTTRHRSATAAPSHHAAPPALSQSASVAVAGTDARATGARAVSRASDRQGIGPAAAPFPAAASASRHCPIDPLCIAHCVRARSSGAVVHEAATALTAATYSSFAMYSRRLSTFWRASARSCNTNTGPMSLYTCPPGCTKTSSCAPAAPSGPRARPSAASA